MDRESSMRCLQVFLVTTNLTLMVTGLMGVLIAVSSAATLLPTPQTQMGAASGSGGGSTLSNSRAGHILGAYRVSNMQVFLVSAALLLLGLAGLVATLRQHVATLFTLSGLISAHFLGRLAWSTAIAYWSRGGDTFLFDITNAATILTSLSAIALMMATLMFAIGLRVGPERRIYLYKSSASAPSTSPASHKSHESRVSSNSASSSSSEEDEEQSRALNEKI